MDGVFLFSTFFRQGVNKSLYDLSGVSMSGWYSHIFVDPWEVLQISLNGQDKFGSIEVLYDLINFLLVSTYEYQVVCLQSTHILYPYRRKKCTDAQYNMINIF